MCETGIARSSGHSGLLPSITKSETAFARSSDRGKLPAITKSETAFDHGKLPSITKSETAFADHGKLSSSSITKSETAFARSSDHGKLPSITKSETAFGARSSDHGKLPSITKSETTFATHGLLPPITKVASLTAGDGGRSLDPKGSSEFSLPVPAQHSLSPGPFIRSLEESKATKKKKRRLRRFSEILRMEGHQIKELAITEDEAEEPEGDLESSCDRYLLAKIQPLTKGHYSWNRYFPPEIYNVKSKEFQSVSRSSIYMSDIAPPPPEVKPKRRSIKLSPIVIFRQAVHKVMTHIFWGKKFQGIEQYQKTTYLGPGEKKGERELLTFNVKFYRSDVQYESLSLRAKTIFSLPSWLRTNAEIRYLHRYCMRLSCFSRYSAFVRKELAKVLFYEKVEKDHFVIRQGRIGWFFYFIVSGSVLVEMQDICLHTGRKVTMIVRKINAGEVFGDLALMHRSVRRASIITNDDCEFLKVDKASFDEVLRKYHESEWKHRLRYLSTHPLFMQWQDSNMTSAVEGSQTREYVPGNVILKNLSIPAENIYFIIQGCCQVVQRVKLWEKVQHYHDDNIMFHNIRYKKGDSTRCTTPTSRRFSSSLNCKLVGNRVYRLVTKYWVIRTLKEGEYFGLGEGEESMSVICNQKVVVLLLSKNVFRKHDRSRDLAFLRAEAISWYPGRDASLVSYLEYKQWNQYRRNVLLEVLDSKPQRESAESYMWAE